MIALPLGGGPAPEIRANAKSLFLAAVLAAALFIFGPTARAAADDLGTEQASSLPPDKSHFTLFDPTPDGQLRDMDTDRPNVTNTPHTIDAGHWQIEIGALDYVHARDEASGDSVRSDDFGFGQFNFRWGLLNNLELNLILDAYEADRVRDESGRAVVHASGFGDTTVGGKVNLWGNDGSDQPGSTALAVQPQFRFPSGHNGLGHGRFECAVTVPFLVNLPTGFKLGLQSGVSHERASATTAYTTGFPSSISVDRAILGNLDVYCEYAGDFTTEKHVTMAQTLDIGATYPLTKNIALDVGINFGLSRTADAIEVLTGISLRH